MVDDVITFSSDELGEEVTEDEIMKEIQQDFQEDEAEDDRELEDELNDEGYTPRAEPGLSPVEFLERNINRDDKISVANLSPEELGKPTLPVRFWRQYAQIFDGKTLYNMPLVALHLTKKAKVNEDTSLSKDAKALELAITNKRVRERKSAKGVTDFIDHIKKKEEHR